MFFTFSGSYKMQWAYRPRIRLPGLLLQGCVLEPGGVGSGSRVLGWWALSKVTNQGRELAELLN